MGFLCYKADDQILRFKIKDTHVVIKGQNMNVLFF